MVKEFKKISKLINCKFTENTKGGVSLFSAIGGVIDIFAGSLRASGKMLDIYALTARNVNGGGGQKLCHNQHLHLQLNLQNMHNIHK